VVVANNVVEVARGKRPGMSDHNGQVRIKPFGPG
jgi:hypothetical protein